MQPKSCSTAPHAAEITAASAVRMLRAELGGSNRRVDVSTTGRLSRGLPEMTAIDPSRPGAGLVRARHSESVLRASIRSAAVMGVALRQSAGSPPRLELTGRKQRGRLESSC
jgi:hypothetical protein